MNRKTVEAVMTVVAAVVLATWLGEFIGLYELTGRGERIQTVANAAVGVWIAWDWMRLRSAARTR